MNSMILKGGILLSCRSKTHSSVVQPVCNMCGLQRVRGVGTEDTNALVPLIPHLSPIAGSSPWCKCAEMVCICPLPVTRDAAFWLLLNSHWEGTYVQTLPLCIDPMLTRWWSYRGGGQRQHCRACSLSLCSFGQCGEAFMCIFVFYKKPSSSACCITNLTQRLWNTRNMDLSWSPRPLAIIDCVFSFIQSALNLSNNSSLCLRYRSFFSGFIRHSKHMHSLKPRKFSALSQYFVCHVPRSSKAFIC